MSADTILFNSIKLAFSTMMSGVLFAMRRPSFEHLLRIKTEATLSGIQRMLLAKNRTSDINLLMVRNLS